MWWRPLVGFLRCVSCLERRKRSGVRIRDQEGSYQGFALDSKSHRQRENNLWLMQDNATLFLHIRDTLYVTFMGEAWRDRKTATTVKGRMLCLPSGSCKKDWKGCSLFLTTNRSSSYQNVVSPHKKQALYHNDVQVNSAKWMPCIFMYYCMKVKYIYFW